MKKGKKKDNINAVFIDKLNHEMKQSETVVYRYFSKYEEQGEEFSVD